MSSKKGIEFLKSVAEHCVNYGGHDAVLKAIRITGGGSGRCTGEFTVAKDQLNVSGRLHGGCAATIVDNITTYALMSTDSHPGVTIDLHVSYLKSAKKGETIVVDAHTIKVGKKLAFIDCVLKKKSDGSILVKGSQTKYVGFEFE